MKQIKLIVILFIMSIFIALNNILQMYFLSGKELINEFALWHSSSVLLLCGYYLILFITLVAGNINYFKYMPLKQVIVFYGHVAIKFSAAILAAVYVSILYRFEYAYIFCIFELLLFILDILCIIYLLNSFKKISNSSSDLSSLKSYEINFIPIECTEDEYKKASKCLLFSLLVVLVECSYILIVFFPKPLLSVKVLFITNSLILYLYHKYMWNKLHLFRKYLPQKIFIRKFCFMLISNTANLCTFFILDDIKIRINFIIIFAMVNMVHSMIRLIFPISYTLNSMLKYLEHRES